MPESVTVYTNLLHNLIMANPRFCRGTSWGTGRAYLRFLLLRQEVRTMDTPRNRCKSDSMAWGARPRRPRHLPLCAIKVV